VLGKLWTAATLQYIDSSKRECVSYWLPAREEDRDLLCSNYETRDICYLETIADRLRSFSCAYLCKQPFRHCVCQRPFNMEETTLRCQVPHGDTLDSTFQGILDPHVAVESTQLGDASESHLHGEGEHNEGESFLSWHPNRYGFSSGSLEEPRDKDQENSAIGETAYLLGGESSFNNHVRKDTFENHLFVFKVSGLRAWNN
jgi:hypothetical protein